MTMMRTIQMRASTWTCSSRLPIRTMKTTRMKLAKTKTSSTLKRKRMMIAMKWLPTLKPKHSR